MALLEYLIAIPLAASFLIVLFGKRFKYAGEILSVISAAALFIISASCAGSILIQAPIIFKVGHWSPPFGIPLIGDGLSVLILVVANMITLAVIIYSIGYARQYTDNWKYYTLLMIMTAAVNGLVMTGDLFNLFVFLEIASITAYALVAFTNEDEALEGAFKYAVLSAVASSFVLLGIALLYGYTSTLNMADMASVIFAKGPARLIPFVSALFLMGFGLKSALAPFHTWMPDAYTKAPATIAAMSSGVLIKTLGIYALVRIFFCVFGMTDKISFIFIALALLSMIGGGVMAFGQSNIRRLLAYSSISQVGYILLGFGIGTPLAITGSIFHLFNHSVAKSLLFLNVGAIENHYGTSDINKISGLVSRDRICGYTNLTGIMSICGIPPFGGFWSKLIIIFACIQAHRPILALVTVAVSILTLVYYLKAYTPALFGTDSEAGNKQYAVHFSMKLAMIALSLIAVFGGLAIMPGPVKVSIDNAVAVLLNGSAGYINTLFGAVR